MAIKVPATTGFTSVFIPRSLEEMTREINSYKSQIADNLQYLKPNRKPQPGEPDRSHAAEDIAFAKQMLREITNAKKELQRTLSSQPKPKPKPLPRPRPRPRPRPTARR